MRIKFNSVVVIVAQILEVFFCRIQIGSIVCESVFVFGRRFCLYSPV